MSDRSLAEFVVVLLPLWFVAAIGVAVITLIVGTVVTRKNRKMTAPPQILYRTVNKYDAVENHLLGILWFRSLRHFRTVEGAGTDELEGIGSYIIDGRRHNDVSDERPIFPSFILSFSEQPMPKHGEFVMKFLDPHQLLKRVMCRVPKGTKVEWHKVTYDKTEHLEAVPNPSEDWCRKHYAKPPSFAHEMEWRLIIFLPPPLRLLNDTLKLCVGNLEGFFRLEGKD